MTSEIPEQGEYYLWRIMIDAEYQEKGYAAQAVELLIKRIKETPNAKTLITSHLTENIQAGRFFESLGFLYTGGVLEETDRLMEMNM